MKNKKHDKIIKDYDKIKSKHLERLANKILKDDDKNNKLKNKQIKGDFLDKF
jgi:hypothetical protein|tara:strand:+ start:432 stop:587 length:156 start_codon:yes stop_codon:yes gene_type:complete